MLQVLSFCDKIKTMDQRTVHNNPHDVEGDMGLANRLNEQKVQDEVTQLVQTTQIKEAWKIVDSYTGEFREVLVEVFNLACDDLPDPNAKYLP